MFSSKIAQKGKSCSRLLNPQNVAANAKSCKKVPITKRSCRAREGRPAEATWVKKLGYLCIREILLVTYSHMTEPQAYRWKTRTLNRSLGECVRHVC